MNIWDYLDRVGERRQARRLLRVQLGRHIDARGWIGIGVYLMVLIVMFLMARVSELRTDEFFKTIATLIVGAFIKDVVGWAYAATKQSGELADNNASLIAAQVTSSPPIAEKD